MFLAVKVVSALKVGNSAVWNALGDGGYFKEQ
jgi:hypothetical protein